MRILAKLSTAAYLGTAIVPAFAENHMDASTVVATVNGTEITLGHMILARENLPTQYQSLPDEQLFQGILEQLIQQTLLSQVNENPESLRVRLTLENDRRMMRAGEAVDIISSQEIGEDDITAAYEEKFSNAEAEREFNASHILVETEEAALNLIEKAKEGADFAELAKEFSTGPSGPNGGQLGWFRKGMMVPPFEEAVLGMEKGAISGAVKTDFGWHVIKLNDVRDLSAPTLEQVRNDIYAELQQQAVVERIKQMQDTGDIARTDLGEFDAGVLKNLSLLDQ
jgi:peptidyl-prolyl cis-trans isomerase C